MLNNIPSSILNDMDNLMEVRDADKTGKRLAAVAGFLENATDYFAEQKFTISDPMGRHEAGLLESGFASAKKIVERAQNTQSA